MTTPLVPDLDRRLAGDPPPLTAFREAVKASRQALAERFEAGEAVEDLVHARAAFVDRMLQRIWSLFIPPATRAALVAVGGYGRGELHPASDVDILILVDQPPEGTLREALEQLVMFLWDVGLEVGHSVRTLEQCVEEAEKDVTVVTNLMESRLVCGEADLFEAMTAATGPDRIWPSDRFFAAKLEEQQRRHARFEDTGYNLEPNIKSNPGGLRDIQMIGWVVKRHFGARTLAELVKQGFLTESEYQALMDGQRLLWKIRFALHLRTGRHDDRLAFDHQRAIARAFGYTDDDNNLAVERFMQSYYRTVMELNRLNEMLLQLFQEAILEQDHPHHTLALNRRFHIRDGFLEAAHGAIFVSNPFALLELFLVMAEHPEIKGVRASTIRLVRAHLHLIDDRFRADIRARSLFLEILRQPQGITHELRRMHRYGVLERYIPAFGRITGRMQFDLFHVYTVDVHTLMVVRNLRRFAVPRFAHEFPLCSEVFQRLPKPELLYLAGLFHDIAKGRGGHHAELGAEEALAFCRAHHLSEYDSELVAWLVRHHLELSATAQHKDIEDPRVVRAFAALVGDPTRLDYLYLLTVADIRGTNPARWNSWTASLLNRLFHETRKVLFSSLDEAADQDQLIQVKQAEALRLLTEEGFSETQVIDLWRQLSLEPFITSDPDEIAWRTALALKHQEPGPPLVALRHARNRGANEIFIVTADRRGLFAQCTCLIDRLNLNILDARIQTTDSGLALNSFFVLEHDGSLIEPGFRSEEVLESISNGLEAGGEYLPMERPLPRKLLNFARPTEINFVQDVENHLTTLHLRTLDRPGLLSIIAHVFDEQRVRLLQAKITTVGATAEDTFTLSDPQGRPLDDPERLAALTEALQRRLDPDQLLEAGGSAT